VSKKRKSQSIIGRVLHKLNNSEQLKQWAQYIPQVEPWKSLEITQEKLAHSWEQKPSFLFFSALEPKHTQNATFDSQEGLVVFTQENAKSIVEIFLKTPLHEELPEGGYIQILCTKEHHKGVGKYLLQAAERVIYEKHKQVYLFVSETNEKARRFYKNQGYTECARATDCIKSGNTEILMTKKLLENLC